MRAPSQGVSPAHERDDPALRAEAATLACTRDPDARVREQACRALDGSPGATDALAARLTDEAEAVRVMAAIGLFVRDDPRGDAVLRGLGPVDEDSPCFGAFHQVWYHHRTLSTVD
ncbi:HEAT repeat domain-containing protein [Streptomyces violascens]|uniref:HEAT repeat domain-containing protein n=1 Tax=Streptomyces violascens TaxID=67381 RepID=UPI0036591AF0